MGEKGVVVGVGDDMGEGMMQCIEHPYRSNPAGGICALCLEEKLGRLVSTSKSNPTFSSLPATTPSPSSPTSPSSSSLIIGVTSRNRTKISFLPKKKENTSAAATLKRSKSVAPHRPALGGVAESSPRVRKSSWWPFTHFPGAAAMTTHLHRRRLSTSDHSEVDVVPKEDEEIVGSSARVGRSRSVGCGSRSFSGGDFLERISNGFGDCSTLRRVESHREAKPKSTLVPHDGEHRHRIIKCGGIFGGFGMLSSSSSYWLSTTTAAAAAAGGGRRISTSARGRSRSWVWSSFASPMRAFRPATAASAHKTGLDSMPSSTSIPVGSSNNNS